MTSFGWTDEAAMRAMVDRIAFAQISAVANNRPVAAHAPLSWGLGVDVRFHLARNNPIVPHLDGAPVLATIVEADAYISPDWYGTPDQVPTWNYRLVRIEGVVRRLDDANTLEQLDALSASQEAQLAPKPAWTRDKLSPARMAALLRGMVGFGIEGARIEGIAKLGQNKQADERAAVVSALRARGRDGVAALMETAA